MMYYLLLLLVTQAVCSDVYSGTVYYHKSQNLVPAVLQYSPDSGNVKVSLLHPQSLEVKLYTDVTAYYINFDVDYMNSTCKTAPFNIKFNITSILTNKVLRSLDSNDSRSLSILFTGSWYNNEMVTVNTDGTISSPYWSTQLTKTHDIIGKLDIPHRC